jgi:hypothetical protein
MNTFYALSYIFYVQFVKVRKWRPIMMWGSLFPERRDMRSYLSWDSTVEEDEKTADVPEDSPFECPKLNRGDIISLEIGKSKGQYILTPVKVVFVLISISRFMSKNVKDTVVQDAEQRLFIEPVVLDSAKINTQTSRTNRRSDRR